MPASTQTAFYKLSHQELLQTLGTTSEGLSEGEARERLEKLGSNELTTKRRVSALSLFLSQFANSLILILLAAAGLIFFVWYFGGRERADLVEGSLIVAIVLLITVLGFLQEWKAEKAIDALRKLLAFRAKVVRSGRLKEIDVKLLVPGDLIILEDGEKVPADIRLTDVANLSVNEASLTGESAAVRKTATPLPGDRKLQVADQKNMAFSGTVVTSGRGRGIVVSTGGKTEIGKIAGMVAEVEDEPTPIQKRLDQIGKVLGWGVLGIAAIVFLFIVFLAAEFSHLGLLQRIIHSFIASVSLAVAAIPEGLPAVVTISLALGTQRMLKRKSLVRKLNSVETLGSTDVICADKTGTLTKGEMTVRELVIDGETITTTGTGYETVGSFQLDTKEVQPDKLLLLLTTGLLCNNAQLDDGEAVGDPTEVALLVAAAKAGVSSSARRLHEMPFSSERKMMSVVVEEYGHTTMYTKGAPEVVLDRCAKILLRGRTMPLTAARRKQVLDATLALSEKALRTLGFAYRPADRGEEAEKNLIFIGLMGLIDPPRTEIQPLIAQCHASGIRVIMITGDHAATAAAVAKEVGIPGGTKTGQELDQLSGEEFARVVANVNVYARVNPGFKMRIVEALQRKHHIVAMTGDGVNDAPALKKADIGIAMGLTGTDVAKEASDMVLLDDHFASIVAAIEEGRGIFENIRKFVNYLLSCNIGEVIVVFLGVLLFRDVLLSATMLLWINVVTDGLPAVALGLDPARPGILRFKPREFQGEIINRRLWFEMILFGLLISAGILGIYWLNLSEGQAEARATAFLAIVLFELIRLFHIRSEHKTPFLSNWWLLSAVGLSLLLQLLIIYVPFFARLFGVAHIDALDWIYIIVVGTLIWGIFHLVQPLLTRQQSPAIADREAI